MRLVLRIWVGGVTGIEMGLKVTKRHRHTKQLHITVIFHDAFRVSGLLDAKPIGCL